MGYFNHPAIYQVIRAYFYGKSQKSLAKLFSGAFSTEVPKMVVAIVATAVSVLISVSIPVLKHVLDIQLFG
jgi:hypothetical protein